jgi:hypothetical protein
MTNLTLSPSSRQDLVCTFFEGVVDAESGTSERNPARSLEQDGHQPDANIASWVEEKDGRNKSLYQAQNHRVRAGRVMPRRPTPY